MPLDIMRPSTQRLMTPVKPPSIFEIPENKSPEAHDDNIKSTLGDLDTAIEICADSNGLFASKAKAHTILGDCYQLAVKLFDGGDDACVQAMNHVYFDQRKKCPIDRQFLIAVRLGAKPDHNAEHKMCSDYASALEHAHDSGVASGGFAAWFSTMTLIDCIKAVRKKRKAAKSPITNNSAASDDEISGSVEGGEPDVGAVPIGSIRFELPAFLTSAINAALATIDMTSDDAVLDAVDRAVAQLRNARLIEQEGVHA